MPSVRGRFELFDEAERPGDPGSVADGVAGGLALAHERSDRRIVVFGGPPELLPGGRVGLVFRQAALDDSLVDSKEVQARVI